MKYASIKKVDDDLCGTIEISACCESGPIVNYKFCSECGAKFVMFIFVLTVDQTVLDSYDEHVIVANTGYEAIGIAMENHGDEGPKVWMDATVENIGIYTGPEK